MRQFTDLKVIMEAKAATGVGNYIEVSDYRHAVVFIDFAGTANMTIKCVGSIGAGDETTIVTENASPDATAAQSGTNSYEFIQMVDLQDGSPVDGDTGIVVVADDHRMLSINVDGLKWLNFRITARSGGNATVKVKLFRD